MIALNPSIVADNAVRIPPKHTARSVESPSIRIFYGA
jgi:hypothetical protein